MKKKIQSEYWFFGKKKTFLTISVENWANPSPNFAARFHQLSLLISALAWFIKLDFSRKNISSFSRLRLGHSVLPPYANKLSLNDSPYSTLRPNLSICNASDLLFKCSSLSPQRILLFQFLKSHNVSLNIKTILFFKSNLSLKI